jgi:hypothetical protein
MSPEQLAERKRKQAEYHRTPEYRAKRKARRDAVPKEERQRLARESYLRNCEKYKERAKRYRLENPPNHEKRRANDRKRKGMLNPVGTPPHVGICEICRREKMLHLDHDHETGEIRGWLCTPCNRGLGYWETKLNAASEYLAKAFAARQK